MSTAELIVIDGRSGAGKSKYALELSAETGFPVLSLDWLYPGWDGLDAGQAMMVNSVLRHWHTSRVFRLPRWDWSAMRFDQEVSIEVTDGLIIEGCGAISLRSSVVASRAIWLDALDRLRRERALNRDGDSYRPHWERWALQEERFIALHRSPELATEVRKA